MLKLRKILLCNYLYYTFFLLVILISLIRLSIPKISLYKENSTTFIGTITKIYLKENKLIIYLKNKETVITTFYFKEQKDLPNLKLGDKVKVTGIFRQPPKNTTENLFNYRKYLKDKRIFYLVEADNLTRVASNKNIYYYLKEKIVNSFNYHPYLYTFILGDKNYLSSNVKRSYQENGISHLFAISGMHITLLVSLINKLLKKFKLSEQLQFNLTILILLFYLALTGLSPSILRGIMFYYLFTLNNIHYFYISPVNLFLTSCSMSLLINPTYLYDVGFQYSYIISLALIISSKHLKRLSYIQSLFQVSLISFFVSIPITLYNFYQLNFLGILLNLLFVPLISYLIFPLAILTSFFRSLLPIFNLTIKFLELLSLNINKISFAKLVFKKIPLLFYFIYFLIILIYLLTRKKKYLLIYSLILLIHYLLPLLDFSTTLVMLDVGQGDSILLKSHNQAVLVDTGGISSYGNENKDGQIFYNTINPYLKSQGIKKLNYLILTHGDKDHLGEAKTIIENMSVKKIILNSNRLNYYEQQLIGKKTIIAKEGLNFKVGKLLFIQLNKNLQDENDSSQIYLVRYKNTKILLTGDASTKSEKELLENYDIGKIDILKVGHHGSKTSTSEELLKVTKPKLALISCGIDNKFSHPNKETLLNLQKYSVKYLITKDYGTISINLSTNKFS